MKSVTHLLLCLGLAGCSRFAALNVEGVQAQRGRGAQTEGARTEVYKTIGGAQLTINIFESDSSKGSKLRPAIVLFFGGGWNTGSPQQFARQARYFASRGMVALTADYRVRSRNQSKVIDSMADARSAVRWVRANAERLGIDPNRIAAGGGSAGGHLAASAAFISEFDDPSEDKAISAVPNALVLFNPALMLAAVPGSRVESPRRVPDQAFLGAEPSRISPANNIKAGGPPTIIFHGEKDSTVPFETAEVFTQMMKAKGNPCNLVGYPQQGHGFFNSEPWTTKTLIGADEFLASLGWLKGKHTLTEP